MGFRFRRRIKVLPGVYLNASRSGLSTSVGMKGAHVTLGHGKVRATAGLPGSGMFYTESQSLEHGQATEAPEKPQGGHWLRVILWAVVGFFAGSILLFWLLSRI